MRRSNSAHFLGVDQPIKQNRLFFAFNSNEFAAAFGEIIS
jgi:hypothetical protein